MDAGTSPFFGNFVSLRWLSLALIWVVGACFLAGKAHAAPLSASDSLVSQVAIDSTPSVDAPDVAAWQAAWENYQLDFSHSNLDSLFRIGERLRRARLRQMLPEFEVLPDSLQRAEQRWWQSTTRAEAASDDPFLTALRRRYPRYYDLKYRPEVSGLSDVQQRIPFGATALSYLFIEGNGYLVRIDKTSAQAYALADATAVARLVAAFQRALQTDDVTAYVAAAAQLYQTLIGQFDITLHEHLLVFPDGPLQTLPFEALLPSSPATAPGFASLPYLVRNQAVSYHWSGTSYIETLRNAPLEGGVPLLSFAPPTAQPGATDRVQMAQQALEGQILTGHDATESAFWREADSAQVIYYAPLIDTTTLAQWFVHPLQPRLLVLEQAVASVWPQLTQALLYHGGKNLLVYRGPAAPAADGAFLRIFLAGLQEDRPMLEALHQAQLAALADPTLASPRQWSGWMLVGDPRLALHSGLQPRQWIAWGLGILLGTGFLIGIRRYWVRQFKRRYGTD
ncbi:CHAT domain-containing protein [Catalinimonas alkaloidigena]|uniref:CHAT domain-containing protein n=1 Tax=Catalinimonas alkaloidigena TaxID=1075417 RepID=A0A1G9PCR2_9BACT|nr:CHAT domain-containing protein [Catalinimonas alkaloidigena]SDL96596.1 CHAT domain-containing protein [Catalinimonas alkaloidigena]